MKGLFEWKILAAILAILIVSSSALVSNSGIKDFFLNSTGNIGDWLGGSPFDSFFTTPQKSTSTVVISLMSGSIALDMESPVNITMGESSISNFKGMIEVNFDKNSTAFLQDGSDLALNLKLERTEIKGVKISSLVLENIDFAVSSENTNVTASDDKIEIYDFVGDITITDDVELSGNVSRVNDGKWSIS